MLFNKWLLCPVVSGLLIVGSAVSVIAQYGWIELGRQDNLTFQLNPEVMRSGSDNSVVAYELYLTAPQETNGVRSIKVQIIARCNSRSQVLSQVERFNDQGLSVKVVDYDISNSERWETPKQDLYGKAFQMVCNNR
jgi:hypothetical protein